MPRPAPPSGIHHLKLGTTDLAASLHFYTHVLGAVHLPQLDHRLPNGDLFAYLTSLALGGQAPLYIELRLLKKDSAHMQALAAEPFNVLTLAVPDRAALVGWTEWLDECGVANSGVLRGLKGSVLVCDDGQGNRLRFYAEVAEMVKLEDTDAGNEWLRVDW
ncbi:hypothetical protein PLICRDRAFT_252405 [Plicaturopsis crispa FD-325 SS-3]|nr:hypothetical protein PLICRDRAFT_252405 [Plicaturopsis crispa FD-325 SS-3]